MKSLALTLLVLLTASTFAQANEKKEGTYTDPSASAAQSAESTPESATGEKQEQKKAM